MAGKTSVVQTLSRGKSTLTDEEDRTRCVKITQWAPDDNITFEVYDFGGYDVYHLTHQFFLTQGALNLLTVNLHEYRCTEQCYTEAVGFWLDTLNARVPGAVVTIVCSKTDLCSGTEIDKKTRDIQERFTQQHDMWERTIQQQTQKLESERVANGGTDQGEIEQQLERTRQLLTRPLRLTGVYCVSSAEPTSGLDTLKSHILETANDTKLFPSLRRILPQTWVNFEQELHDLLKRPTAVTGTDRSYRSSTRSSHTISEAGHSLSLQSSDSGNSLSVQSSDSGNRSSVQSSDSSYSLSVQSSDSGYRSSVQSSDSSYSLSVQSSDSGYSLSVQSSDSGNRSSVQSSDSSYSLSVQSSDSGYRSSVQSSDSGNRSSVQSSDSGYRSSVQSSDSGYRSSVQSSDSSYSLSVQSSDSGNRSSVQSSDSGYSLSVQSSDSGYRSSVQSSDRSYRSSVQSSDSGYRSSVQSSDRSYRSSVQSIDSGYRSSVQSIDSGYRSSVQSIDSDYRSSAQSSDSGYRSSAQSSDSGYRSSVQSSDSGYRLSVQSSDSGYRSSVQSSHRSLKWLTERDCLRLGQVAGLSSDRLGPVLSYLQQVGTILRYTDIPKLEDLVFHDPSGLIDVIKELFHHDLMKVFTNKNPRLKSFSNTYLKRIRKNLSSRGYLPREVAIALLGPHATPVGNVDMITELMEHFGLLYTEWSDEQDEATSTPVGYYIPWYIQKESPKSVKRSVQKRQKKGFTLTCEIAGFCPPGLFERLSVVVNKLIKSRQDWKDVITAVSNTSSLPVIVRREPKDEHGNIIVNVTVQAVQGTQVVWDVIGPLKDKLSALLKEWPGLLYRLVYSKLTQQAKQKGDSQTLSVPSIIPTFEVGPRGCTVKHGGVTLEFPAGCVRDTRFISVEVEAVPVTEDVRTNLTAMSAVLTVEQDFPQRFLRPVTVRLPWVWTQAAAGKETTTVVLHCNRDEGWTVFKADTHQENGGIMFQTDHFQRYRVMEALNYGKDLISWARQKWNDYIADKAYVIVTPKVNILPERTLHLICLSKADDMRDFFESPEVTFDSQIKQRVVLTQDQRIEASFEKDEDVGTDPHDLREGDIIVLCPSTRRTVRLMVKESVAQKAFYDGKIQFTVRRATSEQDETDSGQHFEMFVRLREGQEGNPPGGKPVVLLVNDEFGTSKGGISTINGQLRDLLTSVGAKVIITALNATEEEKQEAMSHDIDLILPNTPEGDKRMPTLDWLTYDHKSRYPNLPSDINVIVGHADVTSEAARNIRKDRLLSAKFILFNHVMPEDTEHHKSDDKVMGIEEKMDSIRKHTEEADVVFSVGPTMHDYYKNQIRLSKPHHLFLPKPSDIFSQMTVTYVETETKVVLCVGRVKGVEKLKGYDLVAKAMDKVLGRFPRARLRVRGVSAEDFPESKEIIQANVANFHFIPLKYGTQQQLSGDFREAHVVLMPSRAEPFGLVGLEAIAAGVPTIVSDQSGLAMFLKAQDDVIFDRPIVKIKGNDTEDVPTLADRIMEILENGSKEFKAAKELEQKLMASKYWEESHRKFLEECGIPQ
ncbi:uncharacterized protein LOC144925005 isoform X2 [Branchiostoma floridae x Branchiostoma belcheri]